MRYSVFSAGVVLFLIPFVALALSSTSVPTSTIIGTSENTTLRDLILVCGYARIIFLVVAILTALCAVFLRLSSRGDRKQLTKAKRMLVCTVIALIIAGIAYWYPILVKSILQAS